MITKAEQTVEILLIRDLISMVKENQIQIRYPYQHRIKSFKDYIEGNLSGDIFIPPLVMNKDKYGDFQVIDGSVRIQALIQLERRVEEKENSPDLKDYTDAIRLRHFLTNGYLSVQVFKGLAEDDINQLYIDFNTKAKKVSVSKLISYDSRNKVNILTNNLLEGFPNLERAGVEKEKRAIMKPSNKNLISLMQLKRLVATFLKNDLISTVPKIQNFNQYSEEENIELIKTWFNCLFEIMDPITIGDYNKSMLSSFPLLNAMAYYAVKDTQTLGFEQKRNHILKKMKAIQHINYKHENNIWKEFEGRKAKYDYIILKDNQINIVKIVNWLEQEERS